MPAHDAQSVAALVTYIALLRGINVGGTGKLAMADLILLCTELGYTNVRTYIQSGNVVFASQQAAAGVRAALQQALLTHMGKPIDVMVRTGAELRAILAANPFPHDEPNKVHIAFLAAAPPAESRSFNGLAGEQGIAGTRELYIYYPEGIGKSKLKLPVGKLPATIRNLNTVARLVSMATD